MGSEREVGMATFLSTLSKCGKHTQEIDARGTSIECFNCGERVFKDLSVRIHSCSNCSVTLDRDLNASLNILQRTVGQPFAACGGLGNTLPVKQELQFVSFGSSR
jgi:putative transposase